MASKKKGKKAPRYPQKDFAWGLFDIVSERNEIVRQNQNSGYRCPICKANQETIRKEIFRKHLLTHGKAGRTMIPSMKEKCEFCPRKLEANKYKRKIHLKTCRGFNDAAAVTMHKDVFAADNEERAEIEINNNPEDIVNHTEEQSEKEVEQVLSDKYYIAELEIRQLKENLKKSSEESLKDKSENAELVERLLSTLEQVEQLQHVVEISDLRNMENQKQKEKLIAETEAETQKELKIEKVKHVTFLQKINEEHEIERKQFEKAENPLTESLEKTIKEKGMLQSDLEKRNMKYKKTKKEKVDLEDQLETISIKRQKESKRYETEKRETEKLVEDLQSKLKDQEKLLYSVRVSKEATYNELKAWEKKYEVDIKNLKEEVKHEKEKFKEVTQTNTLQEIKVDNVENFVGEGSYGVILKANYKDKQIAVKKSKALDLASVTEAVIMPNLDSPYVMCACGISLSPNQISISMELMDLDLDKFLDIKQRDRSPELRQTVVYQCSQGVSYLHSKNIIHRDIKPQNYLVKIGPSGNITVRLTDFGFGHIGLRAWGWMGTRGYIAPEMYEDENPYDEKVDCWSLGAVLYEVLTNDNLVKQEENLDEEKNPNPQWTRVKAYMPKEVLVVKSLLVVNPKDRKSAKEVVNILEM
jgi:hypothetical protein